MVSWITFVWVTVFGNNFILSSFEYIPSYLFNLWSKKLPLFLAPALQYISWNFPMLCFCVDSTFVWKERKIGMETFLTVLALGTQPMLQRRPNCTELRSMKILCRFQKCKQKVPPPSPLKKVFFFKTYLFFGGTVEERFAYIFGIYIKFG